MSISAVTAIDCPKCGAPVSFTASRCDFCQSALVSIENGAAVLPAGLSATDVEGLVHRSEDEIWQNTSASILGGAPYTNTTKGDWSVAQLVSLYNTPSKLPAVELFWDRAIPVRGEVIVGVEQLLRRGEVPGAVDTFAVCTNYRLMIARGPSTLFIPWSQFKSWQMEPYPGGGVDIWHRVGQPVLRWADGSGDQQIKFDSSALAILETATGPIRQAADYARLTPLQKQLLGASRWGLKQGVGLDLPPLARFAPVQAEEVAPETTLRWIVIGLAVVFVLVLMLK